MSRNVWLKRKRKNEVKKIVRDAIDKHKKAKPGRTGNGS